MPATRAIFLFLLTGLVLLGGSALVNGLLPDWRWEHYPVHAVAEGFGAFIALVVATLILLLLHYKQLPTKYLWVATALSGMGILDGFHAVTHAGQAFVWLHSMATLVGGTAFALVWLPERIVGRPLNWALPLVIGAMAAGVSVFSLGSPSTLPVMVTDAGFTFAARFTNIVGGCGFLAAGAFFSLHGSAHSRRETLVLSNHCFLFGISGIIFEFSVLWDGSWWLWHTLRLMAYLIILYYFFHLFRFTLEELNRTNLELEERLRQHKKDARALHESEARFKDIASASADWFWEMGPDLQFTYHSERYFEITGLQPAEKIGTAHTRYVDPMDREASAEKWAAHLADLETHRPFKNFEYAFAPSTGRACHARISGTPIFDPNDKFLGYRGTGTDITKRKRAEESLQQSQAELIKAQEIAKVGSWTWYLDDRGKINVSDEYLRIIGFPADQPPKNLADFNRHIHPDDLERTLKIFDEAVNAPSDYKAEYCFVRPDGEMRHLVELGELVYDKLGRAVGHAGTLQDITEQRLAEEQLRQAQKVEAIGQLTGGVAHDFNNVLSVILGNLNLLYIRPEDDADRDDYLVEAIEATKRAATLTHRLLAFSRKQALDVRDVDVEALVDGMHDMLRRTLSETIEIKVVNPAGLWLCEVDPGQLEQVVLNLAINARDAMPDGGRLIIETQNTQIDAAYADAHVEVSPGDYVLLAVSDNGTGMSPEVQEKIFEPFFTTKDVGKGTGLGLSMVFGFVKQSAGHISVYSEAGKGTTIRIYLPRSRAMEATSIADVVQQAPLGKPGETILVVEDDVKLRRVVKAMLEDLGYAVIVAGEGREALEILSTTPRVDLLLTDVVLPGGMSGPVLAEAAHRDRAGMKIVYMSGYAQNAIVHHGRLDPGVELLSKPFTIEGLGRKLRAVLDG